MKGISKLSLSDRIKRQLEVTSNGCHEWTGYIEPTGYATIRFRGRRIKAHRASWEACYGEIPKGMQVLHTCDVRHCVNPDHLFLGTQLDNMHDMIRKGRKNPVKGANHGCAKLTEDQAIKAKRLVLEFGMAQIDVAKWMGVHKATINMIVTGRTWKHI